MVDLLFDWFGISCMINDNFCFYLQNRLIQTGQTTGQWYSDTSPFNIPWPNQPPQTRTALTAHPFHQVVYSDEYVFCTRKLKIGNIPKVNVSLNKLLCHHQKLVDNLIKQKLIVFKSRKKMSYNSKDSKSVIIFS